MPQPAAELVEQVYQELRRLAEGYLRRERAKSVQATELVHEVYLRLQKDASPQWRDRGHFLAIAAISMRRLLVERARARGASNRALEALASAHPEYARIVELRFFGGLSVEETADVLDLSPATVKRHWTFAKAWLLRTMQGGSA